MQQEHELCDKFYAEGESALLEGKWDAGEQDLRSFEISMRRHFNMEEDVLFPAFEAETGMTRGPTQVMRMEHGQIKGMLDQIKNALDEHDTDQVLGLGETLLILMQQHNAKEENMLYPMCDQHLRSVEGLLKEMQQTDV
ncbi:MAG: hemerythrin domain-containing protein [SAR324 cluster bacterium]|nr:hemerythrin domain-containing protein [SAR324 cluster bacterium]